MLSHLLLAFVAFFLGLSKAEDPHINWVDCHDAVPVALSGYFPGTNISDRTVLPSTLHCGQIVVPMDYAQPIGVTNNITLGMAMYRPKKPKGVVFYNAGGTDPDVVDAWMAALNLTSDFLPDFSGLLDFDLMSMSLLMDIRGTWSSNPLEVNIETVAPLMSYYPTTENQYRTFESQARIVFDSFRNLTSPPGIIQHVGTREVVQDYEMIRRALGYEKIHFLGCSYGTYRAAQYAATFPSRVGHFALDSLVPHGLGFPAQAQYDIVAANRGLLRADAFCQNNASCPFHNKGKGSVPLAFDEILKSARNGTLRSCGNKGSACAKTLSAFEVQAGTYDLLQNDPDFPLLFEVFAAAVEGNGKGFTSPPPRPKALNTLAGLASIVLACNDNRVYDKTFSGFEQSFLHAEQIDRFDIAQSITWQALLICSAWPYRTPPTKPLELQQRMLLITADFDNSAPTEKTTFAWQHMPNSGLIVRHGDDHVSFNLPQQASTRLTKEFLRTGVLPKARSDTFVSVYEPGMQREPVANPYEVPTGFAAGDVDSM